ncbi:carbohydrate deacetylase [Pararhodonellum marinum]|uniref:carbohydrate deacetylase n=1 Tax=Pararhodonellum marinum TaxID=2755358 RepID=UPI00188E2551|nr:ChbG/HpnK family deacetylase [Pararhodonellum marinum]
MTIPRNLVVNADDLGQNSRVNEAILSSYEKGFINSASLMVNTPGFQEAVDRLKEMNFDEIGLHVDLMDGKPISNFNHQPYLKENGCWNSEKFWNVKTFQTDIQKDIETEIYAQLNKMQLHLFQPKHINAHHHLHTWPTLFPIFLKIAKREKIKLRLAQSFNEGNSLKFAYRQFINGVMKKNKVAFSDYFETISSWIDRKAKLEEKRVEIMVHPDHDEKGNLIDAWEKSDFMQDMTLLSQ